jgi:hypothetical protein
MKPVAAILLISFAAASTSVAAREPAGSPNPKASTALRHALEAMAPSRHAQSGPSARPADRDQGDDHAAPRAIQMVCGKDRPAANRSAICPTPVSPD